MAWCNAGTLATLLSLGGRDAPQTAAGTAALPFRRPPTGMQLHPLKRSHTRQEGDLVKTYLKRTNSVIMRLRKAAKVLIAVD